MRICCAFATSLDSPEHIAVAERFGYERAWLYDASQHYPDVWMVLALAAARTSRIGLGPGVLVPQVRHPMVNVAGAATLSALAPGRVAVAFGRGFTGARAMSAKPSGWAYVREYVAAFRALLAGETVDWQGERLRMLHPAGNAPALHSSVPVLIAAGGPKGAGVAHEVGDGLFARCRCPSSSRSSLGRRCRWGERSCARARRSTRRASAQPPDPATRSRTTRDTSSGATSPNSRPDRRGST
jgi:5,10-methylenetetrahydromethanopterin reductase